MTEKPRIEIPKIEVLITGEQITAKVEELGQRIAYDYKDDFERDLVIIGILNGAFMFTTDLGRSIQRTNMIDPRRLKVDFMGVSSYDETQISSGAPKILSDCKCSIKGKNVIIAEDIVDSGYSLEELLELLYSRKPNSIEVSSLLSKTEKRVVQGISVKYLGFEIPDKYVIGYGLDDGSEQYRLLPYIGVVT
jgi:hypoxanthine phosphoribosyltransferase